jgi:hypothetical protein
MAFVDKAKEYLDAGARVSKDVFTKAGSAVQEMSDKGMLKLDITRLTGKRKKVFESLGSKVFELFSEQGAKSITPKTPAVALLLDDIAALNEQISEKTMTLEAMTNAK